MILLLTCDNCRMTSAVNPGFDKMEFPRQEAWIEWGCVRCDINHRWEIPQGRTVFDTALASLKHSLAYKKALKRPSVYSRLEGASADDQPKILFGELIWWWREEAGLQQKEAAAAARINRRELMRVETGKSMPHPDNFERVVRAVRGIMRQAFLVTGSKKNWDPEFLRRVTEFELRLASTSELQILPRDWKLHEPSAPDVELAINEFRRVLPGEPDESNFLFFAYGIHQAFWQRLLRGTVTIDDKKPDIIAAVMNLANILDRSEDKRTKYFVIYELARGARMFLTKPEIADFAQHFFREFNSSAGRDETERRIGPEFKELTPAEKLILTLFDLVPAKYQPRLIRLCKKLSDTERRPDWWFIFKT
jgi:transcriptional regulator with XRE-family HTH domain